MSIPPLPLNLPEEVLARRTDLPLKPAPVTLTGQTVRLEPLVIERDVLALFEVSHGRAITLGQRSVGPYDAEALIWRYMSGGPYPSAQAMAAGLRAQVEAVNGLCLTVVDQMSGQPVGVTNLMSNSPEHLKIELGGIWYSPIVQRTPANTEATYLMLTHCFNLGYRRVEWKCHSANARSRQAALRLGFKFEGIQESHMIIKERSRDTAWFRLLDTEWPAVKQRLEALLNG